MSGGKNKAVFLSYASQDTEAAKRICDALRAVGVEVWFDQNELVGGDVWDAKIRKQIAECALFVPIVSANTQARGEGYFRIEWRLAAQRTHAMADDTTFLLPVVIDDTRDGDARVPAEFKTVQWSRLPKGDAAEKFCGRVKGLLDGSAAPARGGASGGRGETVWNQGRGPHESGETRSVRRLAAIVFSDVVGYSARMQTDEASTLALVESDFAQMRQRCAQHGGAVLKSTGDGLLLCFDSVVDAVTCALAIQAGFAGRGADALQHRIGVHLGDVYHQAGDVAGDGVNLAARLQTAAQPGTICVSDAVFAAVKGKVPMESVALAPLLLKNIAQPLPAHLVAPVGTHLAAGERTRGGRSRRGLVLAAVGVVVLAGVAALWLYRSKLAAPVASKSALASAADFPRDPNLKRARDLIFTVNNIAEDFALADSLVKPLLEARPNDPEVVTVAAEVAAETLTRGFDQSQSRLAQARQLTEHAVKLAPDNPDALAALGRYLRIIRSELGRAEESLRLAIKANPQESRYYRALYSILAVAKPGAETDAFGERMAALFPRDPMVPYEIAVHLMNTDLVAAEAWLDKTLALAPVANAITWKARFMLEVHGDVAGMQQWLERMPERQRTNARLVNTYAVLAVVSGQTGPARRLLQTIADPWLADANYIFPKALRVAEVEQLDGHDDLARLQFEAALKEVQAMLAKDPADLRPKRAELWVQLGLGPDHRDAARAALRVNVQLRPRPYRWDLGKAWWTGSLRGCLLLDDRAEALTELKEACEEPMGRLLLRNLFRVDPKMAPFRDDPEIVALLAEPVMKGATK